MDTTNIEETEFEQFWNYLLKCAGNTDLYWLPGWLKDELLTWKTAPIHSCGCRETETITIKASSGYTIALVTVCKDCQETIITSDHSTQLRKMLETGDVKVKDVGSLTAELDAFDMQHLPIKE